MRGLNCQNAGLLTWLWALADLCSGKPPCSQLADTVRALIARQSGKRPAAAADPQVLPHMPICVFALPGHMEVSIVVTNM